MKKFQLTKCQMACMGIFLTFFLSCKKDLITKDNSLTQFALSNGHEVNLQVEYNAKEITYKKYKLPVDESPEKRQKLLNTYQQEQNYDFSLIVNPQGMSMTMDNMSYTSPIEEWNKSEGKAKKLVNDGNSLTIYDNAGNIIFRGDASSSGFSPQEIYQSFSEQIDKRSITEKMAELASLGADIQSTQNYYFVKTNFQNQNFKKNTISVYDATSGKTICFSEFNDFDDKKIELMRILKYDLNGSPKEIYTETYADLSAGDKETSISILQLRNSIININ